MNLQHAVKGNSRDQRHQWQHWLLWGVNESQSGLLRGRLWLHSWCRLEHSFAVVKVVIWWVCSSQITGVPRRGISGLHKHLLLSFGLVGPLHNSGGLHYACEIKGWMRYLWEVDRTLPQKKYIQFSREKQGHKTLPACIYGIHWLKMGTGHYWLPCKTKSRIQRIIFFQHKRRIWKLNTNLEETG